MAPVFRGVVAIASLLVHVLGVNRQLSAVTISATGQIQHEKSETATIGDAALLDVSASSSTLRNEGFASKVDGDIEIDDRGLLKNGGGDTVNESSHGGWASMVVGSNGHKCWPQKWIRYYSSVEECMDAVLGRSDCSHTYFNHATDGDKNCGCVTGGHGFNCSNGGTWKNAGKTRIYSIGAASGPAPATQPQAPLPQAPWEVPQAVPQAMPQAVPQAASAPKAEPRAAPAPAYSYSLWGLRAMEPDYSYNYYASLGDSAAANDGLSPTQVTGSARHKCSPESWIGLQSGRSGWTVDACMGAILGRPDCSHKYFNHATDGDRNCGCVTGGDILNCSDEDNWSSARKTRIYYIGAATAPAATASAVTTPAAKLAPMPAPAPVPMPVPELGLRAVEAYTRDYYYA